MGLLDRRPDARPARLAAAPPAETAPVTRFDLIEGVTVDVCPEFTDARGSLLVRETGNGLPFVPRRTFFVFDVPAGRKRGDHAHKACHQLLICLKGRVDCIVDNGRERAEVTLGSRDMALHLPPMVWGVQKEYHDDAILMVLASHEYDPDDYIRDYDEFLALVRAR